MKIRIASRRSALARLQSYEVGKALQRVYKELEIEYLFKSVTVDENLKASINTGEGVFTSELQKDLAEGKFEICVHSWKDLPTIGNEKTEVVATLKREDPHDVLLIKKASLEESEESGIMNILTSSPRRSYYAPEFITKALPKIKEVNILPIRGNIETRIKKLLETPNAQGMLLAKAAIDRLLSSTLEEFEESRKFIRESLKELKFMILPLMNFPSAPAQGALAIEIAKGNNELKQMLKKINHEETFTTVLKEREILNHYGGGCNHNLGATYFHRSYGSLLAVKGVEDNGNRIDYNKFDSTKPLPNDIIPCNQDLVIVEGREEFSVALNQKGDYYISRYEAFPKTESSKDMFLWCSGWQSWQKLAKDGHFISGCSDSLGANDVVNMNYLAGRKPNFIKLTHTNSKSDSKMDNLATYKVIYKKANIEESDIKGNFFYWESGSAFEFAIKNFPSIRNFYHGCGAGKTYDILLKILGKSDNIYIFSNKEQWQQLCKKKIHSYLAEQKK